MTSRVITVSPDTSLREVARTMLSRRISGLPVIDESGRLVGVVSEGDLYRRAEIGTGRQRSWWLELFSSDDSRARGYLKEHGRRVEDVMSRRVISVEETTPLAEIAETLELHRIKRVPVMRGKRLVGIISRADLVRALLRAGELDESSKSDGAIRAGFEKALKAESWVADWYINFSVKNGVVKIAGFVGSAEKVRALHALAEGIRGVKKVDSSHLGWE
jgi:CBS domain-containing protein